MAKSARVENTRLKELKAQQAASERKRRLWIAGSASAVVLLIVIAVVVVSLNAPKGAVTSAKLSGTISDPLAKSLSTVPAATYSAVGLGSASATPIKSMTGAVATKDGKPRMIYVGAEYCPFCAGERWALVTALSRFGTFTGIEYAVSSASDTPASIPTLSLKDAKFTSQYLSFESYEVQDRDGKALQKEPDDVTALQSANGGTAIPWIYYAGKAYQSGSTVDGTVFGTQAQDPIGAALTDPSSALSKAVIGGANLTTARICQTTGNKPADVCTSAGVTAAAAAMQ
ncbi:DUF929 family protein [Lapillicoccus sp.]|uniref:DUF929 family protein n=1 Tax=Lapillicoccus sp. TaxID=1909287 RepID=UPI0025F8AE16|nr:DUF929 family protein [Lapillicoccus sp.]